MCNSAETGGSATELSATDAWQGAAVGDEAHLRLIRIVARSSFRQNARNLTGPRGSVSKAIEDIAGRRAAERGLAALLQQSETLLREMQYHVASSLRRRHPFPQGADGAVGRDAAASSGRSSADHAVAAVPQPHCTKFVRDSRRICTRLAWEFHWARTLIVMANGIP